MTGIVKFEPETKVMQIQPEKVVSELGRLISKTYQIAGQQIDENGLQVTIEEVAKDLYTRFKLLDFIEIETAINDGVRGYFGKYYGINAISICQWIQSYIDLGRHNDYLYSKIDKNQKQIAMKTDPTDQEINEMMKAGIRQCFEEYKETGIAIDGGSVRFGWLRKNGYIKLTNEQISEYKEKALETIKYENEAKKQNGSRIEYQEAKNILKEIENQGENYNPVLTLARNIALRDYFEGLIERKSELTF